MVKTLTTILYCISILAGPAQERPAKTNAQEDLDLAIITERIARTSPQGLEVIEKIRRLMPEVQSHRSGKTLGEAIDDWSNGRGQFLIHPVGWEALTNSTGHWTLFFYFRDEEQKYYKAGWEYNNDTGVLFPIEFTNATKFWVRRSENKRP